MENCDEVGVLEAGSSKTVVQMFESTVGIDIHRSKVRFLGKTLKIGVSELMLGRVFNGSGELIDKKESINYEEYKDINGAPLNPYMREYPEDFIQTGVSSIDVMNTLVQGQKLPIFFCSWITSFKVSCANSLDRQK
jgi:vacuolar-type H+-ATPase subunit B/Vma2